ncbi:MAG: TonB C-terminal domain-containing protein [Candidatus Omnitrophica bacterium]|nr:TonB C-terminal domain-containing protein [Candidatus Omnitrophota bacterium]
MRSDKVFQIALFISVVAHGVIFLQNPELNIFSRNNKEKDTEVNYIKSRQAPLTQTRLEVTKKEELSRLTTRINADKKIPPPFIDVDKENIRLKSKEMAVKKITFDKPALAKPDIISIKKKITLPVFEPNKINNPSYISYYQIVREKIRRSAYQNYARTETGEVYLSFVIFSDGSLKELKLSEEKSAASPYLREVASRSINEASPFPAFPEELDYPQLSFNIVISFEIE